MASLVSSRPGSRPSPQPSCRAGSSTASSIRADTPSMKGATVR
ncbi:hypothetical protein ACFQT0_13040 [Hymenobacter humi]|uniref:Uncharacterized protein n=1 Tax=Hymenobacter humi TaxID=1411620 RepID=A0ABW2U3Z9_9BACT